MPDEVVFEDNGDWTIGRKPYYPPPEDKQEKSTMTIVGGIEDNHLRSIINEEGFSYFFDGYSGSESIIDPELKRLVLHYLSGKSAVCDYINKNAPDPNGEIVS